MQPQSPLFSIVIPAYNYARTLSRAVDSAMAQTGDDFEVLVVNDGSTDDTSEVLDQLAARYSDHFHYKTKENGGPAATRNVGIENTQGLFLIFLDADDEMIPGALDALRKHINVIPDTQMITGGHFSYSINNGKESYHAAKQVPVSPLERLRAYLLNKTLSLSNGATVFHRDCFEHYRYPEHFRNCEDVSVFAHALANYRCSSLNEPLARIYKHSDSLRHNTRHADSIGTALIGEVFDPARIPEELQVLREPYSAQRNLSLFRTYFLAGYYARALSCYFAAWQHSDQLPKRWRYRKKAIQAYIRLLTGRKADSVS